MQMTVVAMDQPDKFISQCQFTLMLGSLQCFPRTVYVRQHLAFTWSIRLLVVGSHLALNGKQQHLKVAFLHKPASAPVSHVHSYTTTNSSPLPCYNMQIHTNYLPGGAIDKTLDLQFTGCGFNSGPF